MSRAEELHRQLYHAVTMPYDWASLRVTGSRTYTLTLQNRRDDRTRVVMTGTAAEVEAWITTRTAELQTLVDTHAAQLQAEAEAAKAEDTALRLLLAEDLFGWRWIDGPRHDYDGPCEWHRLIVPPTHDARAYEYPPRGVIPPTFHLWQKWTSDRKQVQDVERALIVRGLGAAYVAALRALRPERHDPDLWLLEAAPLNRCRAARQVLDAVRGAVPA